MRLFWAALIAALGCAGCGPSDILWAASCTATCADGSTIPNAQTVCAAANAASEDAARAAGQQCQRELALQAGGCGNLTCECVAVKNATGC